MKNYYIISLKWTHKNDGFITLWRENGKGYCWYKEWAGTYPEEEVNTFTFHYNNDESTKAIPSEIVDELWKEVSFDGGTWKVLYNDPETIKKLGINVSKFIAKCKSSCPHIHQL